MGLQFQNRRSWASARFGRGLSGCFDPTVPVWGKAESSRRSTLSIAHTDNRTGSPPTRWPRSRLYGNCAPGPRLRHARRATSPAAGYTEAPDAARRSRAAWRESSPRPARRGPGLGMGGSSSLVAAPTKKRSLAPGVGCGGCVAPCTPLRQLTSAGPDSLSSSSPPCQISSESMGEPQDRPAVWPIPEPRPGPAAPPLSCRTPEYMLPHSWPKPIMV